MTDEEWVKILLTIGEIGSSKGAGVINGLKKYLEQLIKRKQWEARQELYKDIQGRFEQSDGDFEFVNYQVGLELLDEKEGLEAAAPQKGE